jgi:hypothetical protein
LLLYTFLAIAGLRSSQDDFFRKCAGLLPAFFAACRATE